MGTSFLRDHQLPHSDESCRNRASSAKKLPSFPPLMSISPFAPSSPAWMSWWDRYLAPGDLRRRQEQEHHPRLTPTPGAPSASTTSKDGAEDAITPSSLALYSDSAPTRLDPSHRHRRQNALLFGGLTFTLLSLALTRRTILRKRIAAYPATFTPSHMHIEPPPGPQQQMSRVEGSLLAIEALGLATLNVVSVFMAGIGGAMCVFDVAEVGDLRLGVVGDEGVPDAEAEDAVEGWIKGAFEGGQSTGEGHGSGGAVEEVKALGGEGFRQGVIGKLEEMKRQKESEGEESKR